MDGLLHIDWTWLMTAQERKDFRRVQQSRDLWKKRAVGRGDAPLTVGILDIFGEALVIDMTPLNSIG